MQIIWIWKIYWIVEKNEYFWYDKYIVQFSFALRSRMNWISLRNSIKSPYHTSNFLAVDTRLSDTLILHIACFSIQKFMTTYIINIKYFTQWNNIKLSFLYTVTGSFWIKSWTLRCYIRYMSLNSHRDRTVNYKLLLLLLNCKHIAWNKDKH